ncbi:MAG: LysR family transcriptional regulator [Deltaproteobacteria bacterium]|nr:LysR family transcriptional regulator [Deltaproteobacteria bacterium]
MNVDQIKTFHKVAATGSFTKAARELFLTQSAVSQQIRALEDEIGGRLFDRSGKDVRLTGEGEILLAYARRLFDLHEELETLFDDLRKLEKGKIAIGATAVIGTYFMPAVISAYHQQHPGIEIDLRMGNSEQVQCMILDREADLGVAGMIEKHKTLNSAFIHREELLFVCSPRNPLASRRSVTIADLDRIPFIWREKGTQTLAIVKRWFQENAADDFPRQTLSLANIEAAKRIVEEGYGVTIVPATAARREIESGLLKRLKIADFRLSVDYGLFYSKDRRFSRAAEAFLEVLCGLGIFSHGANLRNGFGKRRGIDR